MKNRTDWFLDGPKRWAETKTGGGSMLAACGLLAGLLVAVLMPVGLNCERIYAS